MDLRSRVIEELNRRLNMDCQELDRHCSDDECRCFLWNNREALRALKREVERHQPAVFVPTECGWCDCLWPCPTITDTAEELGVKEQV